MRKLRELFRLRFEAKLSARAIAASLNIGNATVCDYLGRARVAKLPWPLPPELDDDAALTARLFPNEGKAVAERPEPDWASVHTELKKKGSPSNCCGRSTWKRTLAAISTAASASAIASGWPQPTSP
jgi:transposase